MAKILRVWPRSGEGRPSVSGNQPPRGNIRRAGSWVTLAFVLVVLTLMVSPAIRLSPPPVVTGQVWMERDVISPFTVTVRDDSAARAAQRDGASLDTVFSYDRTAEAASRERMAALLAAAKTARAAQTSPSAFHTSVVRKMGVPIRRETAEILLANANNIRFKSDLETALNQLLTVHGVTADKPLLQAAEAHGRLVVEGQLARDTSTPLAARVLGYPEELFAWLRGQKLPSFGVPQLVQSAYLDILEQVVVPNLVLDRDRTLAARDAALQRLVRETPLGRGERIVATGDLVSPFQAAALRQVYDEARARDLQRLAGNAMLAALAIAFVVLYARKFRKSLKFTTRNTLMVALPVIFAIAIGRFGLTVAGSNPVLTYAFPAGMVGMLGTILFGSRFAMILSVLASLLFGLAANMDFAHVAVAMAGGLTGVTSLYAIKERREVLMAGVRLAAVNAAAILAVSLILPDDSGGWRAMFGGIVNGLACYVFTIGALPLFEWVFGVTTDVRLMELTSTNHPLLRDLEDRAPGTFQHVLSVTKLAEAAAADVDANFLLIRAGAYFHDIGKMLKPKYFTENQTTTEERRIHSKLSPYMSNLIIKNHVKEGIELGRKHGLPDKVLDFIPQHHGTSLIKFFYNEAMKKAEANDIVHESEFRYPGPRPQSKEAAIVMLADAVDATATAKLTGATVREEDVRKIVRDTIMDKFDDNQFDEANLTLRDLHEIQESFVRSLISRYHKRIDYPTMQRREVRDVTNPSPVAR